MIDALFGSRTRAKLLHLFLNNPDKSFYVREITRLIDEQINSVRRELANMADVGVVTSDSIENRLYYSVNQKYEHFLPLQEIFSKSAKNKADTKSAGASWVSDVETTPGLRLVIIAGTLVQGSASKVDILLVGSTPEEKINGLVKKIEKAEGRELNYAIMTYDDFYYRYSVRDRFITEIIGGKHAVLVDREGVLR